jgi:serine/threonine protein kinase
MPSIYVQSGVAEGAAYGFPPGDVVFIVGRAPTSGIVISDSLVSRQHCRIERVNDQYQVVDLGSHNGVFLNEVQLESKSTLEMQFGDVVRIGESEMVLREGAVNDEGELAGRRLGGYQLVKRIGSGGMGEVYRAVQVALGRQVAIKVLSPELTEDHSFIDRFMSEARAAGKLNHPNVVGVHEVGESDGIYYYSMEYLDGGSVQDKIYGGRALPVLEAVDLGLGTARALEYAEKKGVIHCDIKPDNLMLTEDGEVRLADLGIARTVKGAGKAEQKEGVLGSPHYMAPEQARGDDIDHRIDIYALGASLYRMLCGRTPFSGKNAREIMEKQVYEEPRSLRSIDPSLPHNICRVVAQMMKKKLSERYGKAREVIRDLERVRDELARGERGDKRSESRKTRVVRKGRRKKGANQVVMTGVLVACAAVLLILLSTFMGGTEVSSVEVLRKRARHAEKNLNIDGAISAWKQVCKVSGRGSRGYNDAIKEIARLRREKQERSVLFSREHTWNTLERQRPRTGNAFALKRLAAEYGQFAEKYPGAPQAAQARVYQKQCMAKYDAAALKEVQHLVDETPNLIAKGRFGYLRERWDYYGALYYGSPAGKIADKYMSEAPEYPSRALKRAEAEAQKALDEKRYQEAYKPFEKLLNADIGQLKTLAHTKIEEYKKLAVERQKSDTDGAVRAKIKAECDQLQKDAVKLAHGCQYLAARQKFQETMQKCLTSGFRDQAEEVRVLANGYANERGLFDQLSDYARKGGLASARVELLNKQRLAVKSVSSAGVTVSRSMGKTSYLPWSEIDPLSIYDLLRRPKLKPTERIELVRFALRRGFKAQARKQLEHVLAEEPARRKELGSLIKQVQ